MREGGGRAGRVRRVRRVRGLGLRRRLRFGARLRGWNISNETGVRWAGSEDPALYAGAGRGVVLE